MTIKQKAEIMTDAIRTTTRAFNLRAAKEVEDQARQHAEAEPRQQSQTEVKAQSGFKGKP